ncbi:hypothetical protein Cni_G15803 [Canna indica]|uniref:ARID domain-containing protein n=1 Tax=Canna indica TaxID=4628 RepID=A0AAQ3KIM4_9LILI|nr:hypothetical protein Cni_G15803 [Canna indica]
MAECSTSTTSPTPTPPFDSAAAILRKLQSVGFCFDLDVVSNKDSPCSRNPGLLFDRILSVFFREIYKREEIRPLPAMLGDGRSVDLLKLYSVVQGEGGYDAVTNSSAWQSVAETVGLEPAIGPSLKLVFFKYLDALDLLLQRVSGKNSMRQRTGYKNSSSSLVKCCSRVTADPRKYCEYTPPFSTKNKNFLTPLGDNGIRDDDVVVLGEGIANGGVNHHKRKRQTVVRMLDWVRTLAKNPGDPSIAKCLPSDKNKTNGHAVGEFYGQALRTRKVRFFRRTRRTSPTSSHLQVLHVFENGVDSTIQTKAMKSNQGLHSDGWLYGDQQPRIGPYFQAEVPIWTGRPTMFSTDTDTLKWLGTRTWPPENQENCQLLDFALIGRGRPNICNCEKRGSMECVRFHIAEKRLQLKCELGCAFHAWKYEFVGEEVALLWTEEEEKMFKNIVFQNRASLNKNFWEQLYLYFPFKDRKSIVSYYFNVFLLGWRRYQNHVTPKYIDSDDDETEVGFLVNSSNWFGHVTKICEFKTLVCAQNQQCMDIDA